MDNVIKILEELESTTATSEKIKILTQNSFNVKLKEILFLTCNPYITFGIGKKTFTSYKPWIYENTFGDLKDLLAMLVRNNTGSNECKNHILTFMSTRTAREQEWIKRIILKNLKIGVGYKTLNKVFVKDFIPSFEVMLAQHLEDYIDTIHEKMYATLKMDGVRGVAIKENGDVNIFTREGLF